MLRLLQQRTRLSGQIGEMKRRHGAVIYVPERERDLVARLTRLGKGQPSARALAAIYREIMSSSRAAQGQAPIGFLAKSAGVILPATGVCFGACDQIVPRKTWGNIAKDLQSGALALALLTGDDLAAALASARWRREFAMHFTVVGDYGPALGAKVPMAQRTFIVTPGRDFAVSDARRILILIECKSTQNAIKSLLHPMPAIDIHVETLTRHAPVSLMRLDLARAMGSAEAKQRVLDAGRATGVSLSILGVYPGTEDYGG